jgi:predicted nucleic acid-binding protein
VIAFDSDVLIYAADANHPLGRRVAWLFDVDPEVQQFIGVGSVILLPEALAKPIRLGQGDESLALIGFLGRLELLTVDGATARLALSLGVSYRLRAADAIHLATAIKAGADQFLTNNRKDYPKSIAEIDILYPDDLPEPSESGPGAPT